MPQAIVTPSQTAKVKAQTLWDIFFMNYGFPEKILSDQGHNFKSKLINGLCSPAHNKKLCTNSLQTTDKWSV